MLRRLFEQVRDKTDRFGAFASITVTQYPSGAPAELFSAIDSTVPLDSHIVTADRYGQFQVFVADGQYMVRADYEGDYTIFGPMFVGLGDYNPVTVGPGNNQGFYFLDILTDAEQAEVRDPAGAPTTVVLSKLQAKLDAIYGLYGTGQTNGGQGACVFVPAGVYLFDGGARGYGLELRPGMTLQGLGAKGDTLFIQSSTTRSPVFTILSRIKGDSNSVQRRDEVQFENIGFKANGNRTLLDASIPAFTAILDPAYVDPGDEQLDNMAGIVLKGCAVSGASGKGMHVAKRGKVWANETSFTNNDEEGVWYSGTDAYFRKCFCGKNGWTQMYIEDSATPMIYDLEFGPSKNPGSGYVSLHLKNVDRATISGGNCNGPIRIEGVNDEFPNAIVISDMAMSFHDDTFIGQDAVLRTVRGYIELIGIQGVQIDGVSMMPVDDKIQGDTPTHHYTHRPTQMIYIEGDKTAASVRLKLPQIDSAFWPAGPPPEWPGSVPTNTLDSITNAPSQLAISYVTQDKGAAGHNWGFDSAVIDEIVGVTVQSGARRTKAVPIVSDIIDVAVMRNDATITSDVTWAFSNPTPSDGTQWGANVKAQGNARTVTLPAGVLSALDNSPVASFVVPQNQAYWVKFERVHGTTFVRDQPSSVVPILSVTSVSNGARIYANGRTTAGDGGGGFFTYDSTSVATVDNGIVFAGPGGVGRLIRDGYTVFGFNGKVDPKWYGALGNDSANDATAINTAITQTAARGERLGLAKGRYRCTSAIVVQAGLKWECDEGAVLVRYCSTTGSAGFVGPSQFVTKTSNVAISGLSIEGIDLATYSGNIVSVYGDDVDLRRVTITKYGGTAGGRAVLWRGDRGRIEKLVATQPRDALGIGGIRFAGGVDFVCSLSHVESGDDTYQFVPGSASDQAIARSTYIGCTGGSLHARFLVAGLSDPTAGNTTADFTQPAVGATVAIQKTADNRFSVDDLVYIEVGGYYTITAVADSTHITIRNTGDAANASVGATVPSGSLLLFGDSSDIGGPSPMLSSIKGVSFISCKGYSNTASAYGIAIRNNDSTGGIDGVDFIDCDVDMSASTTKYAVIVKGSQFAARPCKNVRFSKLRIRNPYSIALRTLATDSFGSLEGLSIEGFEIDKAQTSGQEVMQIFGATDPVVRDGKITAYGANGIVFGGSLQTVTGAYVAKVRIADIDNGVAGIRHSYSSKALTHGNTFVRSAGATTAQGIQNVGANSTLNQSSFDDFSLVDTPIAGSLLEYGVRGTYNIAYGGAAEDAQVRVGYQRTANGQAIIDLWAESATGAYSSRLLRLTGTNGELRLLNTGTGGIKLQSSVAANIKLDAGVGAAVATNAVRGFVTLPTCAGAPTGTPNAGDVPTGSVAMIYDTTNNKWWIYNGTWKGVVLA